MSKTHNRGRLEKNSHHEYYSSRNNEIEEKRPSVFDRLGTRRENPSGSSHYTPSDDYKSRNDVLKTHVHRSGHSASKRGQEGSHGKSRSRSGSPRLKKKPSTQSSSSVAHRSSKTKSSTKSSVKGDKEKQFGRKGGSPKRLSYNKSSKMKTTTKSPRPKSSVKSGHKKATSQMKGKGKIRSSSLSSDDSTSKASSSSYTSRSRSSSSSASHESSSSTTNATTSTDSSVPSIKLKPAKKEKSKKKMKKKPKSIGGGLGGAEKIKHNVPSGKRQSLSSSPSSKDSRLESHYKEVKRSKSSGMSRHKSPDTRQINISDLKRNSQMKGMKSMDREKDQFQHHQQQQQGRNYDHISRGKDRLDYEDESRKRRLSDDTFGGSSDGNYGSHKRSRTVPCPPKYNNNNNNSSSNNSRQTLLPLPRRAPPPPNPPSSSGGHKFAPRRDSVDLIRNSQMKGMKSMDREKDQFQHQQQGRNYDDHIGRGKDRLNFEDETRKRRLLEDTFGGSSEGNYVGLKRLRTVPGPPKYNKSNNNNNNSRRTLLPLPRRVPPPPDPATSVIGHKFAPRRDRSPPPRPLSREKSIPRSPPRAPSRDRSLPPRPPSKEVRVEQIRYQPEEEFSDFSDDADDILTKEVVANELDIVAATNTDTSSLIKEEPVVVEDSTNITPSDVVKSDEISTVVSDTDAVVVKQVVEETVSNADLDKDSARTIVSTSSLPVRTSTSELREGRSLPSQSQSQTSDILERMDFEEISDEDFGDVENKISIVDVLGINWASLLRRDKCETTSYVTGTVRQRWTSIKVFQHVGISREHCGQTLFQKVVDKLKETIKPSSPDRPDDDDNDDNNDNETDDTKQQNVINTEKCEKELESPIQRLRAEERKNLFKNYGLGQHSRAFSARRDMVVRRYLLNLPAKSLMSVDFGDQVSSSHDVDCTELLKLSVSLFKSV